MHAKIEPILAANGVGAGLPIAGNAGTGGELGLASGEVIQARGVGASPASVDGSLRWQILGRKRTRS